MEPPRCLIIRWQLLKRCDARHIAASHVYCLTKAVFRRSIPDAQCVTDCDQVKQWEGVQSARLSWLPAPKAVQGVMSSWKGVNMGITRLRMSQGGRSSRQGNAGACSMPWLTSDVLQDAISGWDL